MHNNSTISLSSHLKFDDRQIKILAEPFFYCFASIANSSRTVKFFVYHVNSLENGFNDSEEKNIATAHKWKCWSINLSRNELRHSHHIHFGHKTLYTNVGLDNQSLAVH